MAVWQEGLLQSYRSINVTFQSLLLIALGVLLEFPRDSGDHLALFTSLAIAAVVFLVALFSNDNLQKVIKARGRDVTHVHQEICSVERGLPPEDRVFTSFKVEQGGHRKSGIVDMRAKFLSEQLASREDIEELISGRLGFARRVIDQNLFLGMQIAAVVLFGTKLALVSRVMFTS
ncbi:MAG: hypothetical protein U1A81_08435 [Hydrogenophaga sp.]|nr:hypothetical protein [Hydrogenophaga sp.]